MTHTVKLVADEGVFRGLAKQNLLFHQCLCELIDNSIAAQPEGQKFRIDIILVPKDPQTVELYITDNSGGMDLRTLRGALQLGRQPTTTNRLNEHGFGLKNALATLSGGNGRWQLWTRPRHTQLTYSVAGPFKPEMHIQENVPFPSEGFLPADISTLVQVPVKLSFIQTVQGRGAPSRDLNLLRLWLLEHLGVYYRGYLEQDTETYDNSGTIGIAIGDNRLHVPPIAVPIAKMETAYFDMELGGKVYPLRFQYGTLDEVKHARLVRGQKAKFYYLGNMPSQGIDIRLGKRVLATRQFETIWKTDDGQEQLARHPNYNEFIGELLIPETPRGVLSTVNNKSDFNLDDPDWSKIFEQLNRYRPPKQNRERSETGLRKQWMGMLRATNPDDEVSDEINVWPTGTKIDVYRRTADGTILIYELKVGTGAPIHLYQLKMYWDGLVLQGQQPKEATLLVEDFNTPLEEMTKQMNELTPPNHSVPYNFRLGRLRDKGL